MRMSCCAVKQNHNAKTLNATLSTSPINWLLGFITGPVQSFTKGRLFSPSSPLGDPLPGNRGGDAAEEDKTGTS